MRSREDAEGSEGRPHLQYRQFDGGPSMAVATAHPCCCRPREQLGKSRGEVVQSTTRISMPPLQRLTDTSDDHT
jgi:hypothetical protein